MSLTTHIKDLLRDHLEAKKAHQRHCAAKVEVDVLIDKMEATIRKSLNDLGIALYNSHLLDPKVGECALEVGGRCYLVRSESGKMVGVHEVHLEKE